MRYSEFRENRISGVPTLAGGATAKFKKAKDAIQELEEDESGFMGRRVMSVRGDEYGKKGTIVSSTRQKNPRGGYTHIHTVEYDDGTVADIYNLKNHTLSEDEGDTLNPPSITVGDEVKVGKFRNSKATVKGFKKDDHNQPVLKTNKGDKKLFSLRLSKLQEDELAQAEKDVEDEMKMKKANLEVNAAKRRHQERIAAAIKDAGRPRKTSKSTKG